MKILVAGATGNTGQRLVADLASAGHVPVALVRESSDTSGLPSGVETRVADLTDLKDDVCEGCDAVVFAAGSGGDTGPEMTDKVDRDGAKRLVDLAAKAGVSRFVMLSSAGAENPDPETELGHYMQAKHEADEHLKASGLSYAILRPVALTDEDGTGDVFFDDAVERKGKAHRGDVARALAQAVTDPGWDGRTSLMQSA